MHNGDWKLSAFPRCISQPFWLWSCCLKLANLVMTSRAFHCTNRTNTLFVLCILCQLWYCNDIFFHFSQVIYSLCLVAMTAVRKWERNTTWWWWPWQGTNVTSDLLVNRIPNVAHFAEKELLCGSDSFDPSSGSKLFWIMTYSIFPIQNIYYKIPRKILF